MFRMEYAGEGELEQYLTFDGHISREEWRRKQRDSQVYLVWDDDAAVGYLRYGLFWDSIPFLNMIFFIPGYRGRGFGRQAMLQWEEEMRALGHEAVMTSTQADEEAQHFYRRLGYRECGVLLLDQEPLVQPAELFFIKYLD
ncbi:MAG: GNAT family N-acetyltransferase [Oscillospiraceae bacterium]